MVVMSQKNGMETITLKRVVTRLKMNGFTITIIRVGSTSRQMVLCRTRMAENQWQMVPFQEVGLYN